MRTNRCVVWMFRLRDSHRTTLVGSMSLSLLKLSIRILYRYSHVSDESSNRKMLLPCTPVFCPTLCMHVQFGVPTSDTEAFTTMSKYNSELRERQNRRHCRSDQSIDPVRNCGSSFDSQSMYIPMTPQLQMMGQLQISSNNTCTPVEAQHS